MNEQVKCVKIQSLLCSLNRRKNIMAEKNNKYSRRTVALLWCLAIGIVISLFIYFEQIALLYVLATLTITALLLIVAFADLEQIGRDSGDGFTPKID